MRPLKLLAAFVVCAAVPTGMLAEVPGKYIGTVQAEWLQDGCKMKLLAPFAYIDPKEIRWDAPVNWVIDGASIPQFIWSFGGPFEGKYRDASVIHDVACDQKTRPWEDVHEVFYNAMLTSGVEKWRAKIMYGAVYHRGPRWPRTVIVENVFAGQSFAAVQKALKGSQKGSIGEVLDFKSSRPPNVFGEGPAKGSFQIEITPPAQTLSEKEFQQLKEMIEAGEAGDTAPEMTLEQIREFQPKRAA